MSAKQINAYIDIQHKAFQYQWKDRLSTRDLMYCLLAVAHNASLCRIGDNDRDETADLCRKIDELLPDAWHEIAGSRAIEYEDPDDLAELDFTNYSISKPIEESAKEPEFGEPTD